MITTASFHARRVTRSLCRDDVLLELPVRHPEGADAKRLFGRDDAVTPGDHAAAQGLCALRELRRPAEGTKRHGEVVDRLLAEVGIRVRCEKSAVDPPSLQVREDASRAIERLLTPRIALREEGSGDLRRDLRRSVGRIEIREHHDCGSLLRIDLVASGESRDLTAVSDHAAPLDQRYADAEAVACAGAGGE